MRCTTAVLEVLALASLAGCGSPTVRSIGAMAPVAGSVPTDVGDSYRLHPQDVIQIVVLGEPELSDASIRIAIDGSIELPMIGPIQAAGLTTRDLSRRAAALYTPGILVKPEIYVKLVSSVVQRFTVEGSVTQPGVFDLAGPTTLLVALARAQSPTSTADLRRVAIIRNATVQRVGAVFDVEQIRAGRQADPQIQPGDVVVVTSSWAKSAYRDLLSIAPAALAVFRPY